MVVVADEMEVERSVNALEKQSRVQADAALVEVRCQSTDSAAGVKMAQRHTQKARSREQGAGGKCGKLKR